MATPVFLVLMQLQLIGKRVMGALDLRSLSAVRRACKAMYDMPLESYLGRVFESLTLVELQRVIHRAAREGHVGCVTEVLKTNTTTINAVVNSRGDDGYAAGARAQAQNRRACGRTAGTMRAQRTHAVCNTHARGDMRHAACDVRHTTCGMRRATSNMRHATCDMRYANIPAAGGDRFGAGKDRRGYERGCDLEGVGDSHTSRRRYLGPIRAVFRRWAGSMF